MEATQPMSYRQHGRSVGGFTLVEVLIAIVILSIAAVGTMNVIDRVLQQNDRRRSAEVARRIAANEVERARSAGAWNVPLTGSTVRVDYSGAPATGGEYRVYVDRNLFCDAPSDRPNDAGTAPPPCPGPYARITVRVDHLQHGTWRTRASRVLDESGALAESGTWSLAGTP
jgi:prepilin-type N-terminal cleavage/methylation domain-containing protein